MYQHRSTRQTDKITSKEFTKIVNGELTFEQRWNERRHANEKENKLQHIHCVNTKCKCSLNLETKYYVALTILHADLAFQKT